MGQEVRIEGSKWTFRVGLDPVKVKANLLWGECTPMYEVSLKPVYLKVCKFRHKEGETEAIAMSRWVHSMETHKSLLGL
jgi:hypothetical protein